MSRGLSRKTAKQYARVIRDAETWCAEQKGSTLKSAVGLDVLEYVESKPKTWSTRKMIRSALGHYWALVKRRRPPMWAIPQLPKPTPHCRALDEDDADLLERVARRRRDWKGFVVLLALYTGLRREELAQLRWTALREDGQLRVVGKNGRERDIPMHDVVLDEWLRLRREASDPVYVFPGRFGGHVNPATIWAWVREIAGGAGLELRGGSVPPHRLRHTCLAEINDATGDLRITQDVAGHAKVETTVTYTRATDRKKRQAIASLSYGRRASVATDIPAEYRRPDAKKPPPWDGAGASVDGSRGGVHRCENRNGGV